MRWEDLIQDLGAGLPGDNGMFFPSRASHVIYCFGALRVLTKLINNENDSDDQIS